MAHNHLFPFSYEPSSPYNILAYNHNHTLPEDYISPNSAAAQLSLSPAEMAPILQEQQELMWNEFTQPPAEPATYYNHTTWVESPPPPNPAPHTHPHSVAAQLAQLGITPAELDKLDRECMREQTRLLAIEDEAWRVAHRQRELTPVTATSHHGNHSINHGDPPDHTTRYQLPSPTVHPELEQDTYEGYGIADEPTTVATSNHHEGHNASNRGDSPPAWHHSLPSISNAEPPTHAPPELDMYNTASDPNSHTTLARYCDDDDEGIAHTEPDHDIAIEWFAHELFASGNTGGNWAEEMEKEMGLATQGEYTPANYSPTPAPPPPAPVHPPPPPTLSYVPPRPYYKPS